MPVIGVIAGLLLLVLLLAFFAGRMYYGRLFRKQAHEILAQVYQWEIAISFWLYIY